MPITIPAARQFNFNTSQLPLGAGRQISDALVPSQDGINAQVTCIATTVGGATTGDQVEFFVLYSHDNANFDSPQFENAVSLGVADCQASASAGDGNTAQITRPIAVPALGVKIMARTVNSSQAINIAAWLMEQQAS